MSKLTVALATYNKEKNLGDCLESVKDIAQEIVVVDGSSTDKTVEIAKKYNAKVQIVNNQPIFHINKQKALDLASSDWILQLDADERVSSKLSEEIKKVIKMNEEELKNYQENLPSKKLFQRHQRLLEERDGFISKKEENFVAFFIPRLNYFLGRYLRYGGVYPDGVIRLVRKGYAHFPSVDVHEQIIFNGRVGWLQNPLLHIDSPTFGRYLQRNSRYIDLMAKELESKKGTFLLSLQYLFFLPTRWFILTYIRHKGYLDSWQGFVFSFFSSLRFPRAYIRYKKSKVKSSLH